MNPLINKLGGRLSVSHLNSIYAAHHTEKEFARWAILAIDHLDAEDVWQSLWLLRQAVRSGIIPPDEDLRRVIEMADSFGHWIARLNFCQMMASVPVPAAIVDEAVSVLVPFTQDRLAVVRAWAISALYPFRLNASVGPSIRMALARLKKEKSKAIQARIRQLQNA